MFSPSKTQNPLHNNKPNTSSAVRLRSRKINRK